MSIIRVKKDARYFAASNEPFNDLRLSWEARGLMGYLLSKPDGWEVRVDNLEQNGPAGSRKLKRMLSELRLYGYMNRIRNKLPNGKFEWTTEVYESPSLNPHPCKEVINSTGAKRTSAISTSAKPVDILSTEVLSTEERDTRQDVNTNDRDYQAGRVFAALEQLTGGGLNTSTTRYVDTWLEKHPLIRILQAIELTKERGARAVQYVDKILIGWEANGYPKTREEQVKDAKRFQAEVKPGMQTMRREIKSLTMEDIQDARRKQSGGT